MNANNFNSERYKDQTAGEAISNILRKEKKIRKQIYICSPFAGDTEQNTANARRYCKFAVYKGFKPVAPHIYYTQFLDDMQPTDRKLGITFGLSDLRYCKEIWIFGDKISAGMALEIVKAKQRKIPIRYFTEQCEEVNKT